MAFFKNNKGITLVITLIILSAVLAASAAIASIFSKEIRTSGFVDNSVFAIMAADAGIEKMLYDVRQLGGSATTSYSTTLSNGASYSTCAGLGECSAAPVQFRSTGSFQGTQRTLEVTF